MPEQCRTAGVALPNWARLWMNIKGPFRAAGYGKGTGMMDMLKAMKIQHTGKHHSGIDDCRNIAKILQRLIQDGSTQCVGGHIGGHIVQYGYEMTGSERVFSCSQMSAETSEVETARADSKEGTWQGQGWQCCTPDSECISGLEQHSLLPKSLCPAGHLLETRPAMPEEDEHYFCDKCEQVCIILHSYIWPYVQ